jgi:hypothetical protein
LKLVELKNPLFAARNISCFSQLPHGIMPGYINIIDMEGGRLSSWSWLKNDSSDKVSFGEKKRVMRPAHSLRDMSLCYLS